MKQEQMISILRSEVATLRFINKWEKVGIEIFDNEFDMGNYHILYYILDELGVPEDSNNTPRDKYNNAYSDFYWKTKDPTDNDFKKFIKTLQQMAKEEPEAIEGTKSENKKRVRGK